MKRPSATTTALFLGAAACYLAEWTKVAVGLGVLGMFFEAGFWLSSMGDSKRETEGEAIAPDSAHPAHWSQPKDE